MPRTILVTGDVFLQENLLVEERAGAGRADGLDPLAVQPMPGGAWRLADLARAAIGESSELAVQVVAPKRIGDACRAFAVWAPFAPSCGKKAAPKDQVWRIDEFLGAQRCASAGRLAYESDQIDNPDVLLIEDLNLGFRDDESLWPKALQEAGARTAVILRTCAPLCGGPLWQRLLQRRDRLTVVVSAEALRARGAGLTAPLSWDQTIEEIATEFEGARFANDLALVRRVIVQFGADGAASFTRLPLCGELERGLSERVSFERCLFDPESLEGAWTAKRPGLGSDGTSMLAAAMARHEIDPQGYPLFLALGRGLAAIRKAHENGGGPARNGLFSLSTEALRAVLQPVKGEPEAAYYTAFPHSLLDDEKLRQRPATKSDLLRDFTGSGFESVVSTGIDVVLRGVEVALQAVPKATYGKYTTADRDEIERLNSIRNSIDGYLGNPKDARPLSFAVFGPPGSGKSFAVKQLMRDIAGDAAMSLEFNLSQIKDLAELHQAFHRVRDASIQNRIPFVFWDEFDTGDLKWLKDFLAPMQDAAFQAGGVQHAFGKAIFIFAGGTAASLAEFNLQKNDPQHEKFKNAKGPDFVSRLRGHIDVKGPNPEKGAAGYAHIIRRAVLLRKLLEGNAPQLIHPETKHLAMDAGIARAFLTVEEYAHGARSLESVVTMSNLARATLYGLAELPTRDLLDMHVSADFREKTREPALGVAEIEALAQATHAAYSAYPSPGAPPNPYAVAFKQLPEAKRESNRSGVRATLVALIALGYRLVRLTPGTPCVTAVPPAQGEALKRLEHDRWLREVLLGGWAWNEVTRREVRLNKNIAPYSALSHEVQPLDILAAETLLAQLPGLGFALVQALGAAKATAP